MASCPIAIKSEVEGYIAMIFAPTCILKSKNGLGNGLRKEHTLEPKVK